MANDIRKCSSCGAKNRVGAGGPEKAPVCGRCSQALAWVVDATDAVFQQEIGAPVPVLVDFWAPWCGPCRTVGPILEQLASEHSGRLKVVKVNVDDNPSTAAAFRVKGIPTLVLFSEGRAVDTLVGAQSKAALAERIRPYLRA